MLCDNFCNFTHRGSIFRISSRAVLLIETLMLLLAVGKASSTKSIYLLTEEIDFQK
jgi:hypothetical protein